MTRHLFLAVETGGTKILARIADADGATVATLHRPTTTPDDAATSIAALVDQHVGGNDVLVAGAIAAFGPIIVDPAHPDHGSLLDTPKPGWGRTNLRAMLSDRLGIPIAVDTDVNMAAIAEQRLGAGHGLDPIAYVTVGTGIGGGLVTGGAALHGVLHPEVGHLPVLRSADDSAPCVCPFHANCVEGLAAGPAIAARIGAGRDLKDFPADVAVIGGYLGQLAAALVLAWSPRRIIWGGGLMRTPGLLDALRNGLARTLNGYVAGPASDDPDFCVAAMLDDAGLDGAMLVARALART